MPSRPDRFRRCGRGRASPRLHSVRSYRPTAVEPPPAFQHLPPDRALPPAPPDRRRRLGGRDRGRRDRRRPARTAPQHRLLAPGHRLRPGEAGARAPVRPALGLRLRPRHERRPCARPRAAGGRGGGAAPPRRSGARDRAAPVGRRRVVRRLQPDRSPGGRPHERPPRRSRAEGRGDRGRGDQARRRQRAQPRPAGRGALPRRSGRARDPAARVRDRLGAAPVPVRGGDDRADARDRLGRGARTPAQRLPPEHGADDRLRDRDRLLAAGRQPLPRRAAPGS